MEKDRAMDNQNKIIKEYKEKKINADEAVDRLFALDEKEKSDMDCTEEARKELIDIVMNTNDEHLLNLIHSYLKKAVEKEEDTQ